MKIAHVVDSMDLGGAEMLVSQLCEQQRGYGHEPSIYAVSRLGALGEQMRERGFAVHTHAGSNCPEAIRNFLRIFRETRPDVVHLHNTTPTIYAASAARIAGVHSVVSTRHSLVAPPRRLVVELKYAIAATCCDHIVGICNATADNLKGLHSIPARKIVRVYNGVAPLRRVTKEDCPDKTGFTLVYVGRLEPVKNHTLLLNAFRLAHTTMPDLRLWMVGDGSERRMLENLAVEWGIAGQVTFWGQQLDVAPFFSAADVFIMSSKSEGLPMSLLQAFSLGLPAIVTDVGGMAEVVRFAQSGLTVSATDPGEMAAAILRQAGNDTERKQFSNNAEKAFHAHFTLQTMYDAYIDVYRSAARGRGKKEG